MGLTPDQIAGVMAQDSARTNQMANLIQLPQEMALRQAQLNAAQAKEPTIPVETPYGVIPMTTDQAMRVADQTANRGLREEALALQRQTAADNAANRALIASIAGQNAQTARERLAETKTENLAKGEREKAEQLERQRNNVLRHMETYAKNPKGSAALLASSINQAPSEVLPELVYLDEDNQPFTIPPSVFNLPGETFTKERIQQMAKKEGVTESMFVKQMVQKYGEKSPTFNEQFETTKTPFR